MAGKLLVREIPVSAVYCRGRPIGRIVLNGVTLWEGLRRLPLLQLTDCGSGTTATAIALGGGFAGAVRHSRSDTAAAAGTAGHTASVQDVGRSRADVKLTPTIDAALLLIPAGTDHEVTARLEEGVAALIRAAGDYEARLGQSDRAAAAAGSGHDGISATTGSEDGMGAVTNGETRSEGTVGQSDRSAQGRTRLKSTSRPAGAWTELTGGPGVETAAHTVGSGLAWCSGTNLRPNAPYDLRSDKTAALRAANGQGTAAAGRGACVPVIRSGAEHGAGMSGRGGFGAAAALGVQTIADEPWAVQEKDVLTIYQAKSATQTGKTLEVT